MLDPVEENSAGSGASRLHWGWIGAGVLLGAGLISLFIFAIDPGLERPAVAAYVVMLSVVLVGALIGFHSRGETIRETAIAGFLIVICVSVAAAGFLGLRIPPGIWFLAPFYTVPVALVGGWVGEMLQGTMQEAHDDEFIDWPWVFVSVVIGLTLSAYGVFLGEALLDLTTSESLVPFAVSFLLTGWLVGFFSPGHTAVEPAIAATLMIVVDAGFVILWFGDIPLLRTVVIGFLPAILLALAGGWLGEFSQRAVQTRRRARPEGGRA